MLSILLLTSWKIDVYKRQDVARGEKGLEEVEALQLEKTQLQHQLQVCDKERATLEAVSYTHLDVYKRQG